MRSGFVRGTIWSFLAIACLFPTVSVAEPTLTETIAFINGQFAKCSARSTGEIYYATMNTTVELLNGAMIQAKVHITHFGKRGIWSESSRNLRFSLAALSTDVSVKPTDGYAAIGISCSHPRCIESKRQSVKTTKRQRVKTEHYTQDGLYTCNLQIAEKIQRAFIHAIKISKGKDDLF